MMDPASDMQEGEVVDPVCGEIFPPALATFSSRHGGHQVYFCSSTCKTEFDADPHAFDEDPEEAP